MNSEVEPSKFETVPVATSTIDLVRSLEVVWSISEVHLGKAVVVVLISVSELALPVELMD